MPAARHRATLAAGAVTAVAAFALAAVSRDEFGYALGPAAAERAALADRDVRAHLRAHPHTRVDVNPLDEDFQRVSFFDGSRLLLDAAVADSGGARHVNLREPGKPALGSPLAHEPLLWALSAIVLLAVLGGLPRISIRTLDAAVLAGALGVVWAYDEALPAAATWAGAGLLAYILARCARVAARGPGAGRAREPGGGDVRLLRLGALAAGAAALLVTGTSDAVGDVGFASMAGATLLADGVSPYGHMPAEILHGDTYPILNYAFHLPAALWLPVDDAFSDMSGALATAAAAMLGAAWAIFAATRRVAGAAAAWRNVLGWFAFLPVVLAASAGTNDLLTAAAVALGLALLPRAGGASAALAAGAWVKVAPVLLLPVALAHAKRRSAPRAFGAVLAVSAAACALLLALDGTGAVADMLRALSFQAQRGSLYSVWAQLDAPALQWLAQGLVAGGAAAAAVALARSPELREDPVRVAALAGALLAGLQLSGSYWNFAYLAWLIPAVLLALFTPAPRTEASRGVPRA